MKLDNDTMKKISEFKLIGKNAKWFKYGPQQKEQLIDLVKWIQDGGDPIDHPDDNIFVRGLNGEPIGDAIYYKNDPMHVGGDEYWNDSVRKLTEAFGQICRKPLYRGVSKAELDSILKQINDGCTKFKRDKSTSFSTNFRHAKNFAEYGGGSAIDRINKEHGIDRLPGAVLTVHCTKPILFLDEFCFYYCQAMRICEIYVDDEMINDQEYMPDGYIWSENEWIVPNYMEWRLIDKDKLIFSIN